ncbi:MAG TPA: formate dehydrogenase accessory sulfurtransferase FdhD [Desulfobacteria bacterium]|nr:formate dehydrogenase accessory sulfurtransferase FdhD [Desulfobacteria bacterium]
MLKEVTSCLKIRDGSFVEATHTVVTEEPLAIFVNGRHVVTAMMSPDMREEFVIGHLFTEGIIQSRTDIESLQFEKKIAQVVITHPFKVVAARKVIVSGCGGGVSFLDDSKLPKITSHMNIASGAIIAGVKTVLDSHVHKVTGGVHLVGLFGKQNHNYVPICIAEDIGRHNALDKVIGYGLLKDVKFEETFVASTGRISSEMALKCSIANIPLVASRGATTSLAIELGEKSGLCIIGFVRGEKMNVYTHAERISQLSRG